MKKVLCGLAKLAALLAALGALVYAAVLYWDKIMELLCRVKSAFVGCKEPCCCDESEDYVDW